MGVLCILGKQYIIGSNLSRPVMFRSNVLWLQQQNLCGVLLDRIPVIRFKNEKKKKIQPLFLLTLVTDDTYSFETPEKPENL